MGKLTQRKFPTLAEMFDLEEKYGATIGSRLSLKLPLPAQPPVASGSKPKRKPAKKPTLA